MKKVLKQAIVSLMSLGMLFSLSISAAAEDSSPEQGGNGSGLLLDMDMENLTETKIINKVDGMEYTVLGQSPTLTEDRNGNGKALGFDGSTNYVNLGTNYQITTGMATIAAWVKVDSNPNGLSRIICRSRTPVLGEKDLGLYVRNNGQLEANCSDWMASEAGAVALGSWQHVAVTNDGTIQTLYVNGNMIKAVPVSAFPADQWDVPLLVGAGWNTDATDPFTDHMFKGSIDELKVYNRALAEGEIQDLAATSATVEIQAPNAYQIFQRNDNNTATIPVRGVLLGDEGINIEVSLLDSDGKAVENFEAVQTTVTEGGFEAELNGVPAGLYKIQVTGNDGNTQLFKTTLEQVGVGDLWVVAGQSNAAGYGQYISGEEVQSSEDDPPMTGVHLYSWQRGSWGLASQPIGEVQTSYNHAPGLTFAKEISRMENIPIGILQVAVGGSSISNWERGKMYYNRILDCVDADNRNVKGMFWYQGESETLNMDDGSIPQKNVDAYVQRYTQMVTDLREDLNSPHMTVVTAQLNSHADRDSRHPSASLWYQMKEIQRQLGEPGSEKYVPNTAVISTSGLRLSDGIHNSANSNVILAKRMAKAALSLAYGEKINWQQPNLSHAVAEGNTVYLTFDYAEDGLKSRGDITDFIIRDENGEVEILKAEIDGNHIKLQSNRTLSGTVKVDGLASIQPNPKVLNQRDEPILAFYDVTAEYVDFSILEQLVNEVNGLTKNFYTIGSWKNLNVALASAEGVLDDKYADQGQVDKIIEVLSSAKQNLVNVKELSELYSSNKNKENNNFTSSSWEKFQSALLNAKNVLGLEDAAQTQVDTAKKELEEAIDNLDVKEPVTDKVDKSILEDLIRQADKIKINLYTDGSVALFKDALKNAKIVMANENLGDNGQDKVDTAVKALRDAKDKLVLKKNPANGDNQKQNITLNTPKTGDATAPFLIVMIMALSAGAIALFGISTVKQKRK